MEVRRFGLEESWLRGDAVLVRKGSKVPRFSVPHVTMYAHLELRGARLSVFYFKLRYCVAVLIELS